MHTLSPALAGQILAEAHRLGFDLAGLAPAGPPATADHYISWLQQGYHGEMGYLARPDALARRLDPVQILAGVRSVVSVGINYASSPLLPELGDDPGRGLISRYARGADYHNLVALRLHELGAWIEARVGRPVAHRAYVDTGPLLERDLAVRAGLGFFGKNTHLIHPGLGSWLLLGELLLAVELPPRHSAAAAAEVGRRAAQKGTCGGCTRCLDACPTQALVAPYVLDARRCISYLTIEHKGSIPRDLRPQIGNRVFGCDVCQEVCPWNRRFARPAREGGFQPGPGNEAPPLLDLMALDGDSFGRRFRGSAVLRAKRRGLLRNVAVALGNWADPAAVPALVGALGDPEPLVRGHAAWALGRIGTPEAGLALERATPAEPDDWVRDELRQARVSFSLGQDMV